jgi:hypothetical protein
MGIRDCLISAVKQGAITREEADALQRAYDGEFAQARMSLGDDAAAAAARLKVEKDLRAEAIEKRRRVHLQEAAQDRDAEYLQSYRNLQGRPDVFEAVLNLIEHHGFAGTSSVTLRAKAIIALAHGEMTDVLSAFRRTKLTGTRMNRPLLDDVIREIHGEATGKPEVKAMADAISGVFEKLRQRFNAAGGAIGKIEGGYVPHFHDPRALLRAGRDQWKDFIRPVLDRERTRDPLTGDKLTDARLEQSLDAAFDAATTDGWSKRTPAQTPQGQGALAGQRAEHRFLHFRSADDWLAYDQAFGSGDPIRAIFQHVNGMARDIATMEILGPNPGATVEWLKQIVKHEAGKAIAGQPSLYDTTSKTALQIADKMGGIDWRIDSVYQYVRGRQVVSGRWATGFGNVRNLLTSAVLGSASVLAATTDPFIDMAARYMSGLPITGALTAVVRGWSQASREQVVRAGMIMDDFLHIMGDEARFAGQLNGSEWSKWLADRTVTWSGLQPITQARKHVFAHDFMAMLADLRETAFDALPAYTRRVMEGYGLDRTAWNVMRAIEPFAPDGGAGFLRPADIANAADGPALPKVQKLLGLTDADAAIASEQARAGLTRIAEQMLEMILGETERAVPSGTARARSFVTGMSPRGTWVGEILESGLMFKSFGLSFTTLQIQSLQQQLHLGAAQGAAYASSIAIGLTIGGALALQLKNMANGKDPQKVTDPRFWMQAMQTGGGFGIFGDFLFADVSRFGHSMQETLMGPVAGLAVDSWKLAGGNAMELIQGKNTHAGREAVNFAGRYTPVLSSLWYTRAAYRRVMLDQLQYALDPEAHKNFREAEQRLRREYDQEYFWHPGEIAPARAPQLAR